MHVICCTRLDLIHGAGQFFDQPDDGVGRLPRRQRHRTDVDAVPGCRPGDDICRRPRQYTDVRLGSGQRGLCVEHGL